MTAAELVQKYSRLLEELPEGTMMPHRGMIRKFLDDLAELDTGVTEISYNTARAASLLGVQSKTVTHWAKQGRFPNARKTGKAGGSWLIPAADVKTLLDSLPDWRSA